jgi:hypothetical protein
MTNKEQTIVKEMNRTLLELTYFKATARGRSEKRVSNRQQDLVAAVS